MTTCSLPFIENNISAELLKLVTRVGKRYEINSYLCKVGLVAKYLPHLNIIEYLGKGKKAN